MVNRQKFLTNQDIADIYFNEITPKIKEIDIILKEKRRISIEKVCDILDLEEKEVLNIMKELNINKINSKNLINIMLRGSSFICEVFKRELECGSPEFYSPKDISYIYNIDEIKVLKAFEFLDLNFVTTNQIPTILIQIK